MGLDLSVPLLFRAASFRFFEKNERHCRRVFDDDVLLLVFDGVLRFSEDGEEREVAAGEYYIQRRGLLQDGKKPSDAPKYLYVHFRGEYTDKKTALPLFGTFDPEALFPAMQKLDRLSHAGAPYVEQCAVFYTILSALFEVPAADTPALRIGKWMEAHRREEITLERLSGEFHFSKNHLIGLFKKETGKTPFAYLSCLRVREAARLLTVTSLPVSEIAAECGFADYPNFYKTFLRNYGKAPSEYRKSRQN